MQGKDKLFSQPITQLGEFRFDDQVAEVFPDMIQRSVPGYSNIVSTIGHLTEQFHQADTKLYDLGCSLGAATLAMRRGVKHNNVEIVAVDNSPAMLERCQKHLDAFRGSVPVTLICDDICDVDISNASVVVLNFTLQFIAQEQRLALIKKIYNGMVKGSLLIVSEKFHFAESTTQSLISELHLDFKRANGYSELEISQKRSSLDNVLVPDTIEQHKQRFKEAGFSASELWFQCFNFGSLVAIK
ncbi:MULTISPECIES: carboxy-S-adenosyl-L-methionine synthase CmoA [unclassified Agarivorans]|uniref:carboxy-S-adenosyl-L-methionine synthase CmoA n=1 Tax=unclassified Agarivorans TaxID=2636026 RepID=UPI0026E25542|nr:MULTISPECIES: carboxy-S-adenosyl-L-methionine synthase CmoA [unclassified Agarivorans]MDO6684778.1 carboxy-S-adenosyl-L-methionine synthase CmoA [Agarivorans sp. 3_MG-2023]MDO6715061.1 carboxy-S-adenosyl-L-methionine synthase CmoA [Agarivorans sp. 2_MG-2023]